jgi:hypothetical protein
VVERLDDVSSSLGIATVDRCYEAPRVVLESCRTRAVSNGRKHVELVLRERSRDVVSDRLSGRTGILLKDSLRLIPSERNGVGSPIDVEHWVTIRVVASKLTRLNIVPITNRVSNIVVGRTRTPVRVSSITLRVKALMVRNESRPLR